MGAQRPLEMARFFAAGARALVAAQRALDDRGRASLVRWEEEGLPPALFTWSECRLRLPVAFGLAGKRAWGARTAVTLAPRRASRGEVVVGFRYLPRPQDEEED